MITIDTTKFRDSTLPWHNPEGVSMDKLPSPEWRFLLKEDIVKWLDKSFEILCWQKPDNAWVEKRYGDESIYTESTYATRLPMPSPYASPSVWHKSSEVQPNECNCPSGWYWTTTYGLGLSMNYLPMLRHCINAYWTPVIMPPIPIPPPRTQEDIDEESFEKFWKSVNPAMGENFGKSIGRESYFAALKSERAALLTKEKR